MTKDKTGFPSYHETLQFLYTAIDYEKLISYQYNASTFSLDRMVKMLDYVGNPHKDFPTIHITGTKGKGSTSIMMATVLEQAGLRTGLFTSPHLIDLRERIQINHEMISEGDFVAAATALWPYIQHLRETDKASSPTFFETLTAMAMLYFKQKRVDMAVLEVGLGGRLDSTNVVIPRVSVITNIGFDHTAILGNTLASIAYEKAGIIKQGVPVVSAVDEAEALSVIEKTCREKDARLYLLGRDILIEKAQGVDENAISHRGLVCKITKPLPTGTDRLARKPGKGKRSGRKNVKRRRPPRHSPRSTKQGFVVQNKNLAAYLRQRLPPPCRRTSGKELCFGDGRPGDTERAGADFD